MTDAWSAWYFTYVTYCINIYVELMWTLPKALLLYLCDFMYCVAATWSPQWRIARGGNCTSVPNIVAGHWNRRPWADINKIIRSSKIRRRLLEDNYSVKTISPWTTVVAASSCEWPKAQRNIYKWMAWVKVIREDQSQDFNPICYQFTIWIAGRCKNIEIFKLDFCSESLYREQFPNSLF